MSKQKQHPAKSGQEKAEANKGKRGGKLAACRRMKSQLGPAAATTATAHKIAIIFYTMVKKQVEYDASIWAERDAQRESRFEAKLKRQATNSATNWYPSKKTLPRNRLN